MTALRKILVAVGPNSGAAVMATGIVSIALLLDGRRRLSDVLLVIAAMIWFGLGLVAAWRLARNPGRFIRQARSPAVLTGVAGTAVLGSRVAMVGWEPIAAGMLVVSFLSWVGMIGPVGGSLRNPTTGAAFMLTVSSEALAVLAATLALREHASWLSVAALGPLIVGLALYLPVLARFDLGQLLVGRGEHWVSGGALAIAALAAASTALDAKAGIAMSGAASAFEVVAAGLWVLAVLWLPALLAAELMRPRHGYEAQRWSTVFPFGMYAACSFSVGMACDAGGISSFARIWVWIAVAVWVTVFAGMLRRGVRLVAIAGGVKAIRYRPSSSPR